MSSVTTSPLQAAEDRRMRAWEALDPADRKAFGQFFTPAPLAAHIASCVEIASMTSGPIRVLDPGAGVGSLGVALVERLASKLPGTPLHLTAVELDDDILPGLRATRDDALLWANEHGVDLEFEIIDVDFIHWAADRYAGLNRGDGHFDYVIMNPPYAKVATKSDHRRITAHAACDVTNLYAAFVALSVEALRDGGRLVAITPRSFTNGPYFRPFRQFLDERTAFQSVDLFESRSTLFADTAVLQENVIFSLARTSERAPAVAIRAHDREGHVEQTDMAYDDFLPREDPHRFIHLRADAEDHAVALKVNALPCSLADLDVQVSTGRVVDFRSRDHLRMRPEHGSVPLLYPQHLRGGTVTWPLAGKKPDALMRTESTEQLLFPLGDYVAVKRFTSKEERRRVAPTLVPHERFEGDVIAFENHLNIFHASGEGLDRELAIGLTLYLSSTTLDRYFRTFSGHTQVNATDLRSLRYPTADVLHSLAQIAREQPASLEQNEIDALVERVVWNGQ